MSHENPIVLNNEPFSPQKTYSSSSSSTDAKQMSKLLLRSALQKANIAVQCDSSNDVAGAINAYKEAIVLLERVLATVEKENDKQRLQSIHDSYSERIRLLSSITSSTVEIDIKPIHSRSSSIQNIRKMTSNSSIESSPKSPVWPDKYPNFQLQASKSTPTSRPQPNLEYAENDADDEDESDLEKDEKLINYRLSTTSSSEDDDDDDEEEQEILVQQPSMTLPSLKEESTPKPKSNNHFRARTSSLPKPTMMQRSSSIATMETIDIEPQIIVNKSLANRPSLGSMRRKAANRLSIGTKSNQNLGFLVTKEEHDDNSFQQSHLKLLFALEKSMMTGAHITQRLYIPKNLWQQPNIRLSSMDTKISACESLLNDIGKLEEWKYMEDLSSSIKKIEHFESAVDHLQTTLSKKLKRESTSEDSQNMNAVNNNNHSRDSTIGRIDSKKTQSFMSWGTKLTKSVNAFSLTKTEDQYKNYIEVLQRFLSKIHVLERWLNFYQAEKVKSRNPQHDVMIMKLIKVCTVITNVIGGFIIKDITILLAKWLKRGGSWVNE